MLSEFFEFLLGADVAKRVRHGRMGNDFWKARRVAEKGEPVVLGSIHLEMVDAFLGERERVSTAHSEQTVRSEIEGFVLHPRIGRNGNGEISGVYPNEKHGVFWQIVHSEWSLIFQPAT